MKKLIIAGILSLLFPKTGSAQLQDEVVYSPQKTTFTLFAPDDAKQIIVRIYNEGMGGVPIETHRMTHSGRERWTTEVRGDQKGRFYTFDTGHGESAGIFAKAVGVNGIRGAIIDMKDTNPKGWERDRRPELRSAADLIIYEMHHRDFSIAREESNYPGKFLALTEPWAIDHLQSLGINAVHILPSFDYASVDETKPNKPQYNWGYDPLNYNVPEGSYSTNALCPLTRISEFKQMVHSLHNAGIRVILDVVYNHTFDIANSNFQKTYPDYFFRKNADGTYSDGSGCGNETASEKPMMRQFMIESVKYWINEYHIDGFRFDLMGIHDIETMNAIRQAVDAIDPTIFIYGEGWSAGTCAYSREKLSMKANIKLMPRIAAFSDEIRDGLRGPFDDDKKTAFVGGIPGNEESIKFGIAGAIVHPQVDMKKVNYSDEAWAQQPTQMISYVSCHDDMCLVDRLRTSIPDMSTDGIARLSMLAQTAVLTSQGVPFLLSGEEIMRDKKGVHNSYCSPDSINRLDWANKERHSDVFEYYKKLIALRKNHPAFRLGDADKVRKHLEFLKPAADCVVAFRLKDYAGGDSWKNIIVILNGNTEAKEVKIPKGTYTIVCRDGKISEEGMGVLTGNTVISAPQSAMIIHN